MEKNPLFKHEDFKISTVIVPYDMISYVVKEIAGERIYLVNNLESKTKEGSNGYYTNYQELFTLLNEEMLRELLDSKKTIREIVLEGLKTETFIIDVKGEERNVTFLPVTEEYLMKNLLDKPEYYNFTFSDENGDEES